MNATQSSAYIGIRMVSASGRGGAMWLRSVSISLMLAYEVGSAESQGKPCQGKKHPFSQHQKQNLAGTCAESHAQTDFMGLLRHGERHDPVNAYGSQHEGNNGKRSKQGRGKAIACQRFVYQLIHSPYPVQRQVGIHGLNDGGNAVGYARGVAGCPNRNARVGPRTLPKGNVDFGKVLAVHAVVVNITIDANDLPLSGGTQLRGSWN